MSTDPDKLRSYLKEAEQELEDLKASSSQRQKQLLSGVRKLSRLCESSLPLLKPAVKDLVTAFEKDKDQAIEQALLNFTDAIVKQDDLTVDEYDNSPALMVGNSGALLSEALFQLLEKVALPHSVDGQREKLQAMLEQTLDEGSWQACLDLVSSIGERVANSLYQERTEVEQFLDLVCEQLIEIETSLLDPDKSANSETQFTELQNALENTVSQFVEEHGGESKLPELQQNIVGHMSALGERIGKLRSISRNNEKTSRAAIDALINLVRKLQKEAEKLRQKIKQAKLMAITDPLTRLPNRQAYNDRISQEYMRWKRFKTPLSMLVWDVDLFKRINDTFGHIAGDNALKAVAKLLHANMRETDFIARFGGEEFVMIMPGADGAAAEKIANKIREAIANSPFHMRGKPVEVTISCGATEFKLTDDPEKVFTRADAALYQAKNEGRNRVVLG